jgi:hypothetical protein
MRTKVLILFFFFTASLAKGQVGIQGHYFSLNSNGEQSEIYNSFTAGADYWFRLKNVRLEFRPFVGYERLQGRNSDQSFQSISLEFQTFFYPMDWFNDCQCPTFGKTNDFIKKGFFFTAAPYVGFPISASNGATTATDLVWGLKAGVGIDIGLSDYVTISPIARLAYFHDQISRLEGVDRQGSIGFQVGLILGFRWDTENFY